MSSVLPTRQLDLIQPLTPNCLPTLPASVLLQAQEALQQMLIGILEARHQEVPRDEQDHG